MDRVEKHPEVVVDTPSSRPLWSAPTIERVPIQDTAGDPTISDDGLGDGLFS